MKIRTPCGADWDAMDPRGSARFCGKCDKLVHDLSAMGEHAARKLMRSSPESLCVRYLHDATGQIWFGGEQRVVPTARLNRKKPGVAAAALLAAAPVLFQACGGADPYAPNPYYAADAGRLDEEAPDGAQPDRLIEPDGGVEAGSAQADAGQPDLIIDLGSEGGASGTGEPDAGAGGQR